MVENDDDDDDDDGNGLLTHPGTSHDIKVIPIRAPGDHHHHHKERTVGKGSVI